MFPFVPSKRLQRGPWVTIGSTTGYKRDHESSHSFIHSFIHTKAYQLQVVTVLDPLLKFREIPPSNLSVACLQRFAIQPNVVWPSIEYLSTSMYFVSYRLSCSLHKLWPVRSLLPLGQKGSFSNECMVTPLMLYAALPVVAEIARLRCKRSSV